MTVGVLGGGQLGRMLALAGYPLGLHFRFLDPSPDAPANDLGPHLPCDYNDDAALMRFAEGLDVVTFEFENVPVDAVRKLRASVPVFPPAKALEVAQDRLVEKSYFVELDIPTPPFAGVASSDDLATALEEIGLPAVLKTRRFGYDGKGQFVLRQPVDIDAAWSQLGGESLILEGFVPFERELSIIAARGQNGDTAFYPLVENVHREGILRCSQSPVANLSPALQTAAEHYASKLLAALDYVGVLAIELFQVGDQLIANEFAPRVHNSGHWTIEGAATSQFENHLRAILGYPLGSTAAVGHAGMVNLIATLPDTEAILKLPDAHVHLYDKEPKPGRKLGHVTIRAANADERDTRLKQVKALVV